LEGSNFYDIFSKYDKKSVLNVPSIKKKNRK